MTALTDEYNENTPVRDLGFDVPIWIRSTITVGEVAAIAHGGCDSGAYMPAVTHYTAQATMSAHGDDVMEYIKDIGLQFSADQTWGELCCFVLSTAVEVWAQNTEDNMLYRTECW